MCFNKEVSFMIFFLSAVLFSKFYYTAYKSTDKNEKEIYNLVATIILVISLIQLVEFFLFLNQKKNYINSILTFLIHFTLTLQIVSVYATGYNLFFKDNWVILALLVLFLLSFLVSSMQIKWSSVYTLQKSCRLEWDIYSNKYLSMYLFQTFYLILLLMFSYNIFGYHGLLFAISTLLFSTVVSLFFYKKCGVHVGSLWCFISIFFIVAFLM